MEGTFYYGVVVEIGERGDSAVVRYDQEGSTGKLANENVRPLGPASEILAARTARLSDKDALGSRNTNEQCLFKDYDLKAKLAELKGKTGKTSDAAALFQEAAGLAMNAGKTETANLSMRAEEELES